MRVWGRSALSASLIIGVPWALIYLPPFWILGFGQYAIQETVGILPGASLPLLFLRSKLLKS